MSFKIKKRNDSGVEVDVTINAPQRITEAQQARIDQYIGDANAGKPEHHRIDSAVKGGYFFRRELEYIYAQTLSADIAPPNALRLFTLDTSVNEGADSYVQYIREPVGETKIISDFAADLPRVDAVRREESKKIQWLGNSFDYSIAEIATASMSGQPLQRDKGLSSRESMEREHNDLCWYGSKEYGLDGVLNNDFVSRYVFSVPLNESSSALDIHKELNSFINSINSDNKGMVPPNSLTLVLPPDEYAHVVSTARSDNSTDTTIAEFLMQKNQFLGRIEQAWELEETDKIDSGKRCAFLYRSGMEYERYVAPLVYRQQPVQEHGLNYVVHALGKSGGFYSPKPIFCRIGELAE
jgi:hypothetical protein